MFFNRKAWIFGRKNLLVIALSIYIYIKWEREKIERGMIDWDSKESFFLKL